MSISRARHVADASAEHTWPWTPKRAMVAYDPTFMIDNLFVVMPDGSFWAARLTDEDHDPARAVTIGCILARRWLMQGPSITPEENIILGAE